MKIFLFRLKCIPPNYIVYLGDFHSSTYSSKYYSFIVSNTSTQYLDMTFWYFPSLVLQ